MNLHVLTKIKKKSWDALRNYYLLNIVRTHKNTRTTITTV